MKPLGIGSLVASALSLLLAPGAFAQINALNNLPGTAPFTSGDLLGNTAGNAAARRYASVGLRTTGGSASLVSVSAVFTNFSASVDRVVTGGIYSSVGGNPGALLVSFNQQTILGGQADITKTFLPSSGFTFSSGVDYFVVLTGDVVTTTSGELAWRRDTANTAPVPAPSWVNNGYKVSSDNAGTWGAGNNNNLVRVVVSAPEPASLGLFALSGVLLGVSRRRRRGVAG